jgi:hypothetical protein
MVDQRALGRGDKGLSYVLRTREGNGGTVTEREITEPVDLCTADGTLNPNAVGWTRSALHRTNLRGWGRNKRFEYWAITTPDHIVALNISHHDYRANVSVSVLDRATFAEVKQGGNRWFPARGGLRDPLSREPAEARKGDVFVRLAANDEGTVLRARSPRIDVDLQVLEEPGHESMGVVVPWSTRTFQYTKKDNCLRVRGSFTLDGERYLVSPETSFATHDRGRGRWPYFTTWNWGSGTGTSGGAQIGLQLGGKWTDGTGSTENWIRIDGRLHKISDELIWRYDMNDWLAPWSIRGDHVSLVFHPVGHARQRFNRLIVVNRADSCYGTYRGSVRLDDGTRVDIDDVEGHVEHVVRRW